MQYRITYRNSDDVYEVEADSYGEAANKHAIHRHGPRASAHRATGDKDKSGWFTPILPIGNEGGRTSTGAQFHVM